MMDWTISLVMFGSFFVLVFFGGADLLFYRVGHACCRLHDVTSGGHSGGDRSESRNRTG